MFVKFPRAYDSGSVFYKAGEVRDLDKRTADLLVAQGAAVPHVTTPMDDYSNGLVSLLAQSAVPVMIAQSGLLSNGGSDRGFIIPGINTAGTTITLSATSGSVTVTLGNPLLAGTSADNGRQISFFDPVSLAWRSALITAFNSTTVCTATLASTASATVLGATGVAIGNPLPTNYTGGIWVYLPAGAVTGGLAGFYWATATSTATANGILQVTTAFQAAMNVPFIPTGFSNAVGSGSNFTGSTAQQTLASVTVPGGAMGANGSLRYSSIFSMPATAGNKTANASFGGQSVINSVANGTTVALSLGKTLRNRGLQNSQIFMNTGVTQETGSVSFGNVYASIDTSINQASVFNAQTATATDFIVLEGFSSELMSRA